MDRGVGRKCSDYRPGEREGEDEGVGGEEVYGVRHIVFINENDKLILLSNYIIQ